MQCVDNQRDAIFLNFYSTVFPCSTCFEPITRSPLGALSSTLYHAVWYNHAGESSCYEAVGKTHNIKLTENTYCVTFSCVGYTEET